MEVGNRLLEQVLRKRGIEWNTVLASSTLQLNFRIINHLHMSSFEIFLRIPFHFGSVDFTLTYLPERTMKLWHDEMTDSISHFKAVSSYITYRAQIQDYIKKLFNQKKNEETARYNRGVFRVQHFSETMIMLYQKNVGKLKSKWKKSFIIDAPGEHGVSWKLRQLNGRLIKHIYHEDHFKQFIPRTDYLAEEEEYQKSISLRRSRKKKSISVWSYSMLITSRMLRKGDDHVVGKEKCRST